MANIIFVQTASSEMSAHLEMESWSRLCPAEGWTGTGWGVQDPIMQLELYDEEGKNVLYFQMKSCESHTCGSKDGERVSAEDEMHSIFLEIFGP